MKKNSNMIYRRLGFCIAASVLLASMVMAQGTAEYELTYTTTWSSSTHPTDFPSNPHFSPMIGGTHNSNVEFWSTGSTASDGIKSMAETGATGTLQSEINAAGDDSDVTFRGRVFNSPGTDRVTFQIKPSHPLVTVTSMIAPSPDWFVGVSGLNLLDGNRWRNRVEVELFAYDAGTDGGTRYNSGNDPLNPRENISRIEESPFLVGGTVKSLGTFVFQRQNIKELEVIPDTVKISENDSRTFEVKLAGAPTGNVTVIIPAFTNTDLTRDKSELTFTTANWNIGQVVTVSAMKDDDADDDSETITLTASGGGYDQVSGTVTVIIMDNDIQKLEVNLSVTPNPVTEGESLTVTATLSEADSGSVVVVPIQLTNDTAEPEDYEVLSSITIDVNALTGTGVLVTKEDDDKDDERFEISFGDLPPSLESGKDSSITVTIKDNDLETVQVLFTQNIIGSGVDIYIDDQLAIDDFAFQKTSLEEIKEGTINLDVTASDAADSSEPLHEYQIELMPDNTYHIILHGQDKNQISIAELSVSEGIKPSGDNNDIQIIHGAPDLGEANVRILDQTINRSVIEILGTGMKYQDIGDYVSLAPEEYNVAIYESKTDSLIEVYAIDLSQASQQHGVLILSGSGRSHADGLTIMGVWQDGDIFFPDVVTSTQDQPIIPDPVTVGNYPNPFSGSTHLWFNLHETASVEVEVIDILGRTTFNSIPGKMESGGKHQYEIDTTSWPSGVYFYRVIVSTATDRTVTIGKMTRIK